MMIVGAPLSLFDDVKFDARNPLVDHAERFGGRLGDVDYSAGNIGATIIDPYRHRAARRDIRHAQLGAEWQSRMRGGQIMRVEFFAARGLCALRIEAGESLGGHGCVLVARKRGMPCGGRDPRLGR